MAYKPSIIPQHHMEPAWFMMWRLDECTPFAIALILGIILHQLLLFLIIGYGCSWIYKKIVNRFPRGFVLHWAYGKGLWVFSPTRTMKNPYLRRFVPNRVRSPFSLTRKDED